MANRGAVTKNHIFVTGAVLLLFVGCEAFFTNSWGTAFRRDSAALLKNVHATADNVDDLLDAAVGNPDMGLAVLGKIKDAIKNDGSRDDAILQSAALTAAAEASGVAVSILSHADKLLPLSGLEEAAEQKEGVAELMDMLLKDAVNLQEISEALSRRTFASDGIFDATDSAARQRLAESEFAQVATDGDLFVAAVILLLADVPPGESSADYLDSKTGTVFIAGDPAATDAALDAQNESRNLKLAWTFAQMVDPDTSYGKMLASMGLKAAPNKIEDPR